VQPDATAAVDRGRQQLDAGKGGQHDDVGPGEVRVAAGAAGRRRCGRHRLGDPQLGPQRQQPQPVPVDRAQVERVLAGPQPAVELERHARPGVSAGDVVGDLEAVGEMGAAGDVASDGHPVEELPRAQLAQPAGADDEAAGDDRLVVEAARVGDLQPGVGPGRGLVGRPALPPGRQPVARRCRPGHPPAQLVKGGDLRERLAQPVDLAGLETGAGGGVVEGGVEVGLRSRRVGQRLEIARPPGSQRSLVEADGADECQHRGGSRLTGTLGGERRRLPGPDLDPSQAAAPGERLPPRRLAQQQGHPPFGRLQAEPPYVLAVAAPALGGLVPAVAPERLGEAGALDAARQLEERRLLLLAHERRQIATPANPGLGQPRPGRPAGRGLCRRRQGDEAEQRRDRRPGARPGRTGRPPVVS
jgi:hypothetical protein